jgi:5-methylcytosine-specific restriction protein A
MPSRPKSICRGRCGKLVDRPGYCPTCEKKYQRINDQRRGTAAERGYTYSWQKYSRWYLAQAENQFCTLQLPGCIGMAEVVDHIRPIDKDDPLFRDSSNHQPACKHCNSVKGRREMRGER